MLLKFKANYLYNLFIFLFLLFLFINAITGKSLIGGYKLLIIRSDSMVPSFNHSALILIKSEDDYEVGDVVTYDQEDIDETITHRIIDKKSINKSIFYLTKGDNNLVADGWIAHSRVLGKIIWSGCNLLGALILLQSNDFISQLIIIWFPILVILLIESKKIYQEVRLKN